MGDYSDASFELFGDERTITGIVGEFSNLIHPDIDAAGVTRYLAPDLRYGEESALCATLRDIGIAYEFFQMGDYEYEPQIRLFHPEVPERFGHESATGEWRGPATASGEPLLPASVVDRIFDEMPEDADDVWLREALEIASAGRWRSLLDHLRGKAAPRIAPRRADRIAQLLTAAPTFVYATERDRYLVVLAVSYDHDSDPTDIGERIASPRDAAHWALELTRDGGSAGTQWAVFDTVAGSWTVVDQADIEEAS